MKLTKRILVDAAHSDTTRVAIIDEENKLEELEFDVDSLEQTKGSIYLGYITRIEPSLQAVFVDYGGNRHGFLPLQEIHPDYFNLSPEQLASIKKSRRRWHNKEKDTDFLEDTLEKEEGADSPPADSQDDSPEEPGIDLRDFHISDLLQPGQVLMLQVAKEERGQKGAFLTTYLSLAGRYSILMPNTFHTGGVSKKISTRSDRIRLKKLISEAQLPEDMAIVIRTAGIDRTDSEIYRDMNYLLETWEEIRTRALQSQAPVLVYKEADIIKRTIRDFYTRDVKEILIEGEEAYNKARRVLRQMIPSQIKKLVQFTPTAGKHLFATYGVEDQLMSLFNPQVSLPSGGYLVINTTEALVAVDVNSGKANKGKDIEHTAHQTNLEAATEIARQLRLQNLGGLVVIDFIDMHSNANQRSVENCLKNAIKSDRARIQLGHISQFGLLELSRQRVRRSIVENRTQLCPHCSGRGLIVSDEALASQAFHIIEDRIQPKTDKMVVTLPTSVGLALLNAKRTAIGRLEEEFNCLVQINVDPHMKPEDISIDVYPNEPKDPSASPKESQKQSETQQKEKRITHRKSDEKSPKKSRSVPPRKTKGKETTNTNTPTKEKTKQVEEKRPTRSRHSSKNQKTAIPERQTKANPETKNVPPPSNEEPPSPETKEKKWRWWF